MSTINLSNTNLRSLPSDAPSNSISSSSAKKDTSTITSGISVYDIYGLEEGFSHKLSGADKVTLSPVGRMLSEAQNLAESKRETWSDPSKILESEVDFNEVFKEVQSEDGGLVFRKFNSSYLNQIQNAPDALVLYEQFNKQDKNGIVVTSTNDVDQIVFKLREIAAQDRYNSIVELANKTNAISEAEKNFSSVLTEEYPDLKGVELEFSTKGDELVINGGKLNGLELSDQQLLKIERMINGRQGEELKQALFSLREVSVEHYNRYTESGRNNPITNADFDERLGGVNNYLGSFGSRESSQIANSYKGETSYFSGAADYISARLGS